MTYEQLVAIRDEISALLLAKVDGNYDAERALATMAARQLEQMTCMGGSTRSLGETEIVRLVQRFDDTRQSVLGPWPVSNFMMEQENEHIQIRNALKACVEAHKGNCYDDMSTKIKEAELLLGMEKGA